MNRHFPDRISWALLSVGFFMALHEWLSPTLARPTGKWSFVFGPLWDRWGSGGIIGAWIGMGLVAFAADVLFRTRK